MRHLTAALALLDGLPEDEPHLRKRWEVVFNLAEVCGTRRAFERAQEILQEYLALVHRAGYMWGIAAAYCEMGWALRESHQAAGVRTESARRRRIGLFEQSLRIADQYGLTDWKLRARVSLAYVLCQFRYDLPRPEVGGKDRGAAKHHRPRPTARRYVLPQNRAHGRPLRRAVQRRRRPLTDLRPGGLPGPGPAAGWGGRHGRDGGPLRLCAGAEQRLIG